ncbi:MAG TPA: PilZ domain-containing protein [Spirochaetota bacterium]|nr:PilZ domain-containing protein [Spirochaetota bacterium]
MKIDGVRHITDKNELIDIFKKLFEQQSVMLKTEGMNIKVDCVKTENNRISIKLPDPDFKPKASAVFTRHEDEIYFTHIIPHGHEGDLLIFETEGIEVFKATRKEDRKSTDEKSGRKALITNIISPSVVEESFRHNRSRAEWVRSEITGKFEGRFEHIRVFFSGDRKSDSRMKWVLQDKKPVFIHAIHTKQDGTDSDDYSRYMNEIYYSDPLLKDSIFNSEIIVPMLYKGMMPFGYIQINHTEKLTEDALTYSKRMGLAFSESVSKDMLLFRPSEDKMMIIDLSQNGLGILFKEKNLIRHFREDESLVFTVHMPENRQATMMSRVMNINQINNYYRIGCLISSIDPVGDNNYREFLCRL